MFCVLKISVPSIIRVTVLNLKTKAKYGYISLILYLQRLFIAQLLYAMYNSRQWEHGIGERKQIPIYL